MMKVKIKKVHTDAVIPSYSKEGDAGMDLVSVSSNVIKSSGVVEFKTGLSIEIPKGYVGLIFPRSSISLKSMTLANCVGVIDSGYRGEISVRFKQDASSVMAIMHEEVAEIYDFSAYEVGDRIAQLIILPYPEIQFEEVEELSQTERGTGGYGSTGE